MDVRRRRNVGRRLLGVLVCGAPLALLVASLVAHTRGSGPRAFGTIGFGLIVTATIVALLNAYLSFGRPILHHIRNGSSEGYRQISGLPGVGSLFAVLGVILDFGGFGTALIGLVAVVLDTGGLPWFAIATWKDESLWDR